MKLLRILIMLFIINQSAPLAIASQTLQPLVTLMSLQEPPLSEEAPPTPQKPNPPLRLPSASHSNSRDTKYQDLLWPRTKHPRTWLNPHVLRGEWAQAQQALKFAIQSGDFTQVRRAIARGACVNPPHHSSFHPLNTATALGYLAIVQELVEAGAYTHSTDDSGNTAMDIALQYGHTPIIQFLEEPHPTHADLTLPQEYVSTLSVQIAHAQVRAQSTLTLAIQTGNLSLMIAAINAGARVNARNKLKQTPLHIAAYFGADQLVPILLSHGAQVFAIDCSGMTPLDIARRHKHQEVINILESYIQHIDGCFEAARTGNVDALQAYLKDSHIDINHRDAVGNTMFHVAVLHGHTDCARALVTLGANFLMPCATGRTPFTIAHTNANADMVKLLEKCTDGAQSVMWFIASDKHNLIRHLITHANDDKTGIFPVATFSDRQGQTLLHLAIRSGTINVIRMLLTDGIDKLCKADNNGTTPIDLALQSDNQEILEIIWNFMPTLMFS